MFRLILEMFTYPFMVRALCMGVLVALCSALLGVTLVLKRYSMIGDGLSHVGFGALAIATALNAAPLAVAVPVVIAAAFLLLRLSVNSKIKGDAAIALISTGSLAVGVMVVSMTTGMNTDVYNYLFGSILSMSEGDVVLTGVVSAVILALFVFFYNRIFAVTFDETFARATGLNAELYNMVIAVLTALYFVDFRRKFALRKTACNVLILLTVAFQVGALTRSRNEIVAFAIANILASLQAILLGTTHLLYLDNALYYLFPL